MDSSKLISLTSDDAFWAERERQQAAADAAERSRKERARATQRAERLASIPARYHEPFQKGLSKVDPAIIKHCKQWDPATCGGQGIGLLGASGMGKTRLLCRILFRISCSWLYLPAYQFSDAVAEQWEDGGVGMRADQLLKSAHRVKVLFLDDLGDEKHTDSVSSALKGLIEHRSSRKLPTLWTSNLDDEQLAAKHGERGPAIVRRLAEFSWMPE